MNKSFPFVLEAAHLSKDFYSNAKIVVQAVRDVSLEASQGEILFICGPNGSGKTTLLSMLGCLIKPVSGRIRILGQDVASLGQGKLSEFRLKNIGFIFQSFRLLDSLTVLENVELMQVLAGTRRPASLDRAKAIIEELGIVRRSNFFPRSLSGGEKQRVAIARALVNDPPLVLADEPTGSLDSQAGNMTMELLSEAVQKRQKTAIIVSHDLRIRNYAHRILEMEDGCLREVRPR